MIPIELDAKLDFVVFGGGAMDLGSIGVGVGTRVITTVCEVTSPSITKISRSFSVAPMLFPTLLIESFVAIESRRNSAL